MLLLKWVILFQWFSSYILLNSPNSSRVSFFRCQFPISQASFPVSACRMGEKGGVCWLVSLWFLPFRFSRVDYSRQVSRGRPGEQGCRRKSVHPLPSGLFAAGRGWGVFMQSFHVWGLFVGRCRGYWRTGFANVSIQEYFGIFLAIRMILKCFVIGETDNERDSLNTSFSIIFIYQFCVMDFLHLLAIKEPY